MSNKRKRSRSRSRERSKKDKKEHKSHKDYKERNDNHNRKPTDNKEMDSFQKPQNKNGKSWHGRKEEDKSENWNADKISQGELKNPGYDVLNIIRKERAEEQEKVERNFVEKGWTKEKVKVPLNIYEQLMNKHIVKPHQPVNPSALNNPIAPTLIEVLVNDRLGKKERIKCSPQDKIGDFKKLISAKTGTRPDKIRLQRQHQILKDHITLDDYEIKHEMQIDMYYN